ncbi:MAG: hypothetical protein B6I22_06010 [Desulfobacteraceae bacterium 4572_123]|nr:MAG: hypothetical protein B6I22_06010 [Desulfobacteraceae bacterium 4572_123]
MFGLTYSSVSKIVANSRKRYKKNSELEKNTRHLLRNSRCDPSSFDDLSGLFSEFAFRISAGRAIPAESVVADAGQLKALREKILAQRTRFFRTE